MRRKLIHCWNILPFINKPTFLSSRFYRYTAQLSRVRHNESQVDEWKWWAVPQHVLFPFDFSHFVTSLAYSALWNVEKSFQINEWIDGMIFKIHNRQMLFVLWSTENLHLIWLSDETKTLLYSNRHSVIMFHLFRLRTYFLRNAKASIYQSVKANVNVSQDNASGKYTELFCNAFSNRHIKHCVLSPDDIATEHVPDSEWLRWIDGVVWCCTGRPTRKQIDFTVNDTWRLQ